MSDGGTPDISKIVNLILQNPGLVEEISSLAKKDSSSEPKAEEQKPSIDVTQNIDQTVSSEVYRTQKTRNNRSQLLGAFKPYVSEERAKAIDSMISIAEILEVMKSR